MRILAKRAESEVERAVWRQSFTDERATGKEGNKLRGRKRRQRKRKTLLAQPGV